MSQSDFDGELREIARPAQEALAADRRREIRARTRTRAVPYIVAFPALYFVACAALRGAGIDFGWPLWLVALASLVPPLLYFAIASKREIRKATTPEERALAHVDDAMGLKDRMTTAREFLRADDASPWMRAAIRDAEAHAAHARGFRAAAATGAPQFRPRHGVWLAAALLLLVSSTWIGVRSGASGGDPVPEIPSSARGAVPPGRSAQTKRKAQVQPERAELAEELAAEFRDQSNPGSPKEDAAEENSEKKSRGEGGSGQGNRSQNTQGQSAGSGRAGAQAPVTKTERRQARKKRKPRDSAAGKRRRKKRKGPTPLDKASVASSGRGRGRASSENPTTSTWSSKDQAVANEEEDLEDEDEVDDEDEESEARGGLQPSLRQRKPPVNRDLNLSFGGGKPPPNANGRGGPGLPKKQRGVAQLVLGIPYPDQISGPPNPGRTKVTQERIEPQAQPSDAVRARAQSSRSAPFGTLARPLHTPWMQDVIRNFTSALDQARRAARTREKRQR